MKALYFNHPRGLPSHMLDRIRALPGLELEVISDWEDMTPEEITDLARTAEILLLSRGPALLDSLAEDPGRLRNICYLHGSIRLWIGLPIIRSGITVTNWGDHPGVELGMASFVLLQCCLFDVHRRIMAVRNGGGKLPNSIGGMIKGLQIGVYGYGFAGREFVRIARALDADCRIYDPYAADVPEGCTQVDTLDELFNGIQALVIHAGLTDETRKSVTAERLSRLPDHGVVVNTARGAIIDQEALFAELKSGRLRAGLDVLDPDSLPEDHEARTWENLIWTCHRFKGGKWPDDTTLVRRDETLLENLEAILEGRPVQFVIDEARYNLMT